MGFNLKFKDRKNKSQRQQGLIASDGQGCFEPPSVGSDIFSNQRGVGWEWQLFKIKRRRIL